MAGRRVGLAGVCAVLTLVASPAAAGAQSVGLGTAESFAVLGGSAVTNTGSSVISGNLGVSPSNTVTGFPPGTVVNGSIHAADAVAAQAKADLVTAYDDAAGRASTGAIAADLGGSTLTAGVYSSASTIGLTGDLTLNGQGNPDAVFIFQAGSSLTTASASRVVLINGARACNVFWQVGSSATLGTNSSFVGSVLALTSITATTGSAIDGRLLARNGATTLDTNTVTRSACATAAGGETPSEAGAGEEQVAGGGSGGDGGDDGTAEADGPPAAGGPPRFVDPPTTCVSRPFYARVRGASIAAVTFRLDGRVVKRVRAKMGRTTFVLLIRPGDQHFDAHRITARLRFTSASGRDPRTLRLVYQRCGTAAAAPQFTG